MREAVTTEPAGGPLLRGTVSARTTTVAGTFASATTAMRRRSSAIGVVTLALVAFVPTLLSSPGRMPADTKLYLYLDPGRLTTDAPWSFDPSQYAGWVPHQHITYLWPSGPWFWLFDTLGVPDWIAHRLWLGTLFLVAGLGVRWAAGRLGIGPGGALVAALVYQLSPYVLPYVSRTSLMLLPWAGLGWIVALTARAAARGGWRDAAILALVIATVGSPNATALLMIAPAPMLWLIHAAAGRLIPWRRAAATAARIGVLSIGVSMWWIAMLGVQGRYGAAVLDYSESLEAVSSTSTASEVLRGMGYWVFYLRDSLAASTSASTAYMTSLIVITAGYALLILGLFGLAATRWVHRRYALLLFVAGAALGVGVHRLDDPAPITDLLVNDTSSGLALALRSSTRAVPMMVFGLALGIGALVSAVRPSRSWQRALIPLAVVVLVVANMPSLWRHDYVDPALDRDQEPPAYWDEAADALDAGGDGLRVIQAPGQEFGAYRWGITVDQPLPGVTRRPVVTRDVLPLGSPQAMDLLFAFDDRFQDRVVEPASIAPTARLFGADTIWVANDTAYERFRTPRPRATTALFAAEPDGLARPVEYGGDFRPGPSVAMLDDESITSRRGAVPRVMLVPVEGAVPVVRAKADVVVLSGNGDGVVDAAAAGLIDGYELIRYSADAADQAIDNASALIISDTNRDRARRWNSSQDRTGFTETGDSGGDATSPDAADSRLPVFSTSDPATMTTAHQRGPVTAVASSYGEPDGYRPEDRAAMAIDGDPSTAWRTGDRFFVRGQSIELRTDQGIDHITFVQPKFAGRGRHITGIELRVSGRSPQQIVLDESSLGDGQRINLQPTGGPTTITVEITDTATPTQVDGPAMAAVGFAEIDVGLGPTVEVVTPPSDLLERIDERAPMAPVALVFTRWRADPRNRYRSDPERSLVREFTLPSALIVDPAITARLAPRVSDAVLHDLLGIDAPVASRHVVGSPTAGGLATVDGDPSTAWVTPFAFIHHEYLDVALPDEPLDEFTITQPDGPYSLITSLRAIHGKRSVTLSVPPPDADGNSTIELPRALRGGRLRLVIDEIDGRVITDRRYGEPVFTPAAISEISIGPRVQLPETIDLGCRSGLLHLDGEPLSIRLSGAADEVLAGAPFDAAPCGASSALTLSPGTHELESEPGAATGVDVDRVVLTDGSIEPAGPESLVPTEVTSAGRLSRQIQVDACPAGCWLVLGEGFNEAWEASAPGLDLGVPVPVDGGFNGWWIPPGDSPTIVTISWAAQRSVTIGFVVSGVAILVALALVVFTRRRRGDQAADVVDAGFTFGRGQVSQALALIAAGAGTAAAMLLINPDAALWVGAVGALVAVTRRPRLAAYAALATACFVGLAVINTVRRDRPAPSGGWIVHTEWLHTHALTVVVLALMAAVGAPATRSAPRTRRRRRPVS
jgi:arabinofuranan 3-O-arabinosyltransferase